VKTLLFLRFVTKSDDNMYVIPYIYVIMFYVYVSIGDPEVISRLVCSTVWTSKEAGDEIWSCVKHRDSRQNCILYEAEAHLETARVHYQANHFVSAYEQLAVASIIGNNVTALVIR
jgi:hypothetical protein